MSMLNSHEEEHIHYKLLFKCKSRLRAFFILASLGLLDMQILLNLMGRLWLKLCILNPESCSSVHILREPHEVYWIKKNVYIYIYEQYLHVKIPRGWFFGLFHRQVKEYKIKKKRRKKGSTNQWERIRRHSDRDGRREECIPEEIMLELPSGNSSGLKVMVVSVSDQRKTPRRELWCQREWLKHV